MNAYLPWLSLLIPVLFGGGLAGWVLRNAQNLAVAQADLKLACSDITTLKREVSDLKAADIRFDTIMNTIMPRLEKLDKIDTVVVLVEQLRSALASQDYIPRRELEAKFSSQEKQIEALIKAHHA